MSYRVTREHIENALLVLNDMIGKETGEVGSIKTYNYEVVQLVNSGGGIRTLSHTSTKREAYDTLQALINFHLYTQERPA